MGQSFSHVVDEKKERNEFQEAFKLLKIEQTMRERLECVKAKLYIDALNDECIPIVCAVDKFHALLVDVKVDNEETLRDQLKSKIRERLEKHLSGDHLEELEDLMSVVLMSVLKTQITHEVQQTHVVHANRSVLRIDYFLYLESSGLTTALFYYVQVGVIDMARVRLPVLIYELTRATKADKLGDAGEKLKAMADSTILLNDAAQTLSRAAKTAQETFHAFPNTVPSITQQRQLTDGDAR